MTALDATGLALLAGILAHPEEDAPRLVFADYLQEQGQEERAEFIRVQVELARIHPEADPKKGIYPLFERWKELDRRERELLAVPDWRNAAVWFCWDGTHLQNIWGGPSGNRHPTLAIRPGELDGTDRECLHCSLSRGFVDAVTCTSEDWLSHAEELLKEQPVREVVLTTDMRVEICGLHDERNGLLKSELVMTAGDLRIDGCTITVRKPCPKFVKSGTLAGYLEAIYGVKFRFTPASGFDPPHFPSHYIPGALAPTS